MKKLWPELLVLILFLLGDVLWDGLESAVAGVASGIAAFLILLLFKKKKPVLILEGLFFGGVIALGEFVDFPGGTLLLMELLLGVALVAFTLAGKNIIGSMTGDLGKGLFGAGQSRIVSLTIGLVFLLHSISSAVMVLTGVFNVWASGALFAVCYAVAIRISSKKLRDAALNSAPCLRKVGDGVFLLEKNGKPSGRICMTSCSSSAALTLSVVSMEIAPHEFIGQLEGACRATGAAGIFIDSWPVDDIELEMQGYLLFDSIWKKKF